CGSFFYLQQESTKNRFWYFAFFLLAAMVSTLFKESGIVWFVAPVYFHFLWNYVHSDTGVLRQIKAYITPLCVGSCGALVYFLIRFSLMRGLYLGAASGTYALNFSPLHILKNYVVMLAGTCAAFDPVALLGTPRKLGLFLCSAALSMPFLITTAAALWRLWDDKRAFKAVIGMLLGIAGVSAPFVVMNHVAEMSVYSAVFLFAIWVSILFSWSAPNRSFLRYALTLLFAGMLLTCGHKFSLLWEYTHRVDRFVTACAPLFEKKPRKVFIYYVEDVPLSYSIYCQPTGYGAAKGTALRSLWGWEGDIRIKMLETSSVKAPKGRDFLNYDTVLVLTQSGTIRVLKNAKER
ncbi:MAG: hypothetical protein IJ822_03405, partial [Pyramidobacter sp.]|nr:hypothetical protein [Pyramidobacter sp.]